MDPSVPPVAREQIWKETGSHSTNPLFLSIHIAGVENPGLPKNQADVTTIHQDACRKYSAGAALGMRCGRMNAKLVCARVTGLQLRARVTKAGGNRAHAVPDEQQPRAESHATRSAFLALASRARVRDLQHPITHHTCGVSAWWRGV